MGYLAIRLSHRLRLPVVTSFLLLGIFAGPEGLGIVNESVIGSLRIVEPIALGMITFAAGEQLYLRELGGLSRRHFLAVGLETILPVLLVGTGAFLVTGRLAIALPIGAIAGTTGLATVMSTLKETGARGGFTKLLGFATASDNFFAIVAFTLVLPLAVGIETGSGAGALLMQRIVGLAASVGIGFVAGFVLSRLIKQVRSTHELSMLVLAHVLLVVGITWYFKYSVLLAGLAMGATAVNLTREIRDRDRAFNALGTLEFPVIAIFFLWAGASLHIRALFSIGGLFGVYLVARSVGKLIGPLSVALGFREDKAHRRRFIGLGVSLLPQAGAAVGLGILARDSLPVSGQTILAAVLASVVVFELIGPLGVHWAARYVGEANHARRDQPLTLPEAIDALHNRRARIVTLVDSEAGTPDLTTPGLLVGRLDANLIVVPVSRKTYKSPLGSVVHAPPSTAFDNPGESAEHPSVTWGPEIALSDEFDPGDIDQTAQLLQGYSPDLVIMSRADRCGRLLASSEDLSLQLGCPVLEIPLPPAGAADKRPPRTLVEEAASWLATLRHKGRRMRTRAADRPRKNPGRDTRPPGKISPENSMPEAPAPEDKAG